MIEAAIFDMDGLISDTEPLWGEVMVKSFRKSGISLTREECWATQGVGTREAIEYWYHRYPGEHLPPEEMFDLICQTMLEEIDRRLVVMPGVMETLEFFATRKIPMALASGSPMNIIEAVVRKAGLRKYFYSIQSAENLRFGKPNPAVFLEASDALGVPHYTCLVFEDSVNGVLAAKAAKMKVVAVPDPAQAKHPFYVLADVRLRTLKDFNATVYKQLLET